MNVAELERSLQRLAGPDPAGPDISAIRSRARRRRRRRASVRTAGVVLVASSCTFALGLIVQTRSTPADAPAATARLPQPAATPADLSRQLVEAVRSDDAATAAVLVQAGADPDLAVGDGITLLMIAAFRGDLATVDVLLAVSAEDAIDQVNDFDATALRLAAQGGHSSVVRRLVDAGADPNRLSNEPGARTPLMEAARFGQPNAVEELLELGADPHLTDRLGRPTAFYALDSADPNAVLDVFRRADVVIEHSTGDPARSISLADQDPAELVALLCSLDTPYSPDATVETADS